VASGTGQKGARTTYQTVWFERHKCYWCRRVGFRFRRTSRYNLEHAKAGRPAMTCDCVVAFVESQSSMLCSSSTDRYAAFDKYSCTSSDSNLSPSVAKPSRGIRERERRHESSTVCRFLPCVSLVISYTCVVHSRMWPSPLRLL